MTNITDTDWTLAAYAVGVATFLSTPANPKAGLRAATLQSPSAVSGTLALVLEQVRRLA